LDYQDKDTLGGGVHIEKRIVKK